LNKNIIVGNYV